MPKPGREEQEKSSIQDYCVEFTEAQALYLLERARNEHQGQSEGNWLEAV